MELPSASGRLATDAYLSVNDQQQVPVQKQDLQGTGKRGSEGRVEALREKKILEEEKAQNMGRTCREVRMWLQLPGALLNTQSWAWRSGEIFLLTRRKDVCLQLLSKRQARI